MKENIQLIQGGCLEVMKSLPTMSEVYQQDCIEGMKNYPDKYFDLLVGDPPYGININHSIGRRKGYKPSKYKKAYWDNDSPPLEYFSEAKRVSKNQIIWGANHFISKMPYDSSCWLLWDKGFSENVTFAQFEMAWTSFNTSAKKYDYNTAKQQNRIHPTQKPIALYDWIFKNYASEGMKILDTHLGSGSSRIAAYKANLDFVGFEIDSEYFEAQEKRYKDFISQMKLF